MRLIIAGPRDFEVHPDIIERVVVRYGLEPTELVNGMATGVDESARLWREKHRPHIPLVPFPAPWDEWQELGLSCRAAAGPYRNFLMAEYGDTLLVMKRRGAITRGTASMLKEMERAIKPTYVWEPE